MLQTVDDIVCPAAGGRVLPQRGSPGPRGVGPPGGLRAHHPQGRGAPQGDPGRALLLPPGERQIQGGCWVVVWVMLWVVVWVML